MSRVSDLLDMARSQLGTKETGINNVKYNTWFYGHQVNGSDYAWCVVFIAWCFWQAGLSRYWLNGNVKETGSCNYVMQQAKKLGLYYYDKAQMVPGDIVLFQWNSTGKVDLDHIGILESNNPGAQTCVTLEGNQSDAVTRITRRYSQIDGFYRPAYGEVVDPVTGDVDFTQAQFNEYFTRYLTESALLPESDYAKKAITWLVNNGYIEGDQFGAIAPQKPAARQELFIAAYRAITGGIE